MITILESAREWFKQFVLGEPPAAARFDILVDANRPIPVSLGGPAGRLTDGADSRASYGAGAAPATSAISERQSARIRARERPPQALLERQTRERRQRLSEVIDYRDKLQEILDSDWAALTRDHIYQRALEGYRCLYLLERTAAEDGGQIQLELDNVPEILEKLIQHARQDIV